MGESNEPSRVGSVLDGLENRLKSLQDTPRVRHMLQYLMAHFSAQNNVYGDSDSADILRKMITGPEGPLDTRAVLALYEQVRIEEKKVPALFVHGDTKLYSGRVLSLESDKGLSAEIETSIHGSTVTLNLQGSTIVTFTADDEVLPGKRVDIQGETLEGRFFFNPEFFSNYDLPKNIESDSDVRNVAKTFFRFNGKNHVALVQYLHPEGSSTEHYHTLPEVIVQLAGTSYLELRYLPDDSVYDVKQLKTGDVFEIPANTVHLLRAHGDDSITVPVKQTNPRRSDHFHKPRSRKRIYGELDNLVDGESYNSGDEMISELIQYYQTLSDLRERANFVDYVHDRIVGDVDQNTLFLLTEALRNLE